MPKQGSRWIRATKDLHEAWFRASGSSQVPDFCPDDLLFYPDREIAGGEMFGIPFGKTRFMVLFGSGAGDQYIFQGDFSIGSEVEPCNLTALSYGKRGVHRIRIEDPPGNSDISVLGLFDVLLGVSLG